MTLTFFNWQGGLQPNNQFNRCSPNLDAVTAEIGKRFGGYNLGCYGRRPIRGGVAWSSHSFGAAKDWRIDDDQARAACIAWLLENHELLGVQAIHDYHGCRIWRVGRGWKTQPKSSTTGMGQAWAKYLHIETTPDRWADDRPVANRFGVVNPGAPELIDDAPPYVPEVLRVGVNDPDRVRWLQQIINERNWASPRLAVDGQFGAKTEAAVKTMQKALRVGVDGIYGPKTALALHHYLQPAAA